MNQISEGKLIALRRLERLFFATVFRGVLKSVEMDGSDKMVKSLEDYCYSEFKQHGCAPAVMRRLDKITKAIFNLFNPDGKPDGKRFNTKQFCLITMLLFEEMQEDFDCGQNNKDVVNVFAAIFDVFNNSPEQWDNERYMKAMNKRKRKVLDLLQKNELFLYKDVKFV